MPLKVMTVLGTRPEIIRLSRVIELLDRTVDHVLVHTGQSYDHNLSDVFFEDLALRPPDHRLGIDTSSLGSFLGGVLVEIEPLLAAHRPDAVLVLGDTNSSIAAVLARRMKITVYHMEAGNRSFDANVPEEVNRRLVDHVADFNLAYTEHARRNLLREGLDPRRIYVTGSPLREVFEHFRPRIEGSDVLARLGLQPRRYLLASLHREENVDDECTLRRLMDALQVVAGDHQVPVVVSTHPRTRHRMAALPDLALADAIRLEEPFGYLDYNRLQQSALCVLSDSGTISEESAILGFPAVTLRNSMERPEAMDTGGIVLTGFDVTTIRAAVSAVVSQQVEDGARPVPAGYEVTNCAQRVVNLIVGTARLNRVWANLR